MTNDTTNAHQIILGAQLIISDETIQQSTPEQYSETVSEEIANMLHEIKQEATKQAVALYQEHKEQA